jgi:hypothetical protein
LPKGGFRHFFHKDLAAAVSQLEVLDKQGNTSYIAQATYDEEKIRTAQAHNSALPYGHSRADRKKERSQDNAVFIKNFFLDIDCGEKWPVKTQKEGALALNKFVKETGLPFPTLVSSGNGLYAHWILDEAIPTKQWRSVAFLLKKVVAAYSPAIGGDASRTSDSASVLRSPGVHNRKNGVAKEVKILKESDPITFTQFTDALGSAAKKKKINRDTLLAPKPVKDINAEFFEGLTPTSAPADANKIADNCAQIGLMRQMSGDISEPLWYSCIGVLAHCKDGDNLIHAWSSGHPDYSVAETNNKISQWRAADLGPSTCANLGITNSQGCVGCPHNGRIKSPIVLGRPDPEVKEIPLEQCPTPEGYRRSDDGLYVDEDGRWVRFYDQDLYPDNLAYDESLGYEVMTIRHKLPHEGDMECTVRSSLVNDPKALLTTLADNHIKVVGVKEKKYMVAYLESYQARLQRQRRMTMLLCQMGWKEARNGDRMFVLGKKIFHKDGRTESASLAKNVPVAAKGFHSQGDLKRWVDATELLSRPNMEPFAFALLAGGFGAPLMKFTGFPGALVSLVGDSGAGKTLMLRWIVSVWGYHDALMMLRDDTKNALVARLGVYGTLPLVIDEVTNIEGRDASDFAYKITHGRDKVRLTKNSEEKTNINSWNTLAVTSSNASLIDKLSSAKLDASAEINRIFEYPVYNNPEFCGQTTTNTYWTLDGNYGLAGEEYAKFLVSQHPDKIRLSLDTIRSRIETAARLSSDERFWGAAASVAIYGGMVAQKLGLIKFSTAQVLDWTVSRLTAMKADKTDMSGDAVDILAQFLDAHAGNTLIVKGEPGKNRACIIIQSPRGSLDVRFEVDNLRIFLSRSVLKKWLARSFGSYTAIKNELMAMNALMNPNKRKVLGSGTYHGGVQQATWEIDLKCPQLNDRVKDLIETAKALEQDPQHVELEL